MSEWSVYTGDVKKEFYDVKLFDGSVFVECWPFHTGIHGQQVSHIRRSKQNET